MLLALSLFMSGSKEPFVRSDQYELSLETKPQSSFAMNASNRSSFLCPPLNGSTLLFSEFKYSTLTKPGVEVAFWVLAILAIILNALVIAARCRYSRYRTSPLSLFLVNLAASDFLLATGKIFFLVAAQLVTSWCDEATDTTKNLCYGAHILSNISISMTSLMWLAVSSFAFKEIVGCLCCSISPTSKRSTSAILLILWLFSVAYAVYMTLSYTRVQNFTIEYGGRSFLNWHTCWAYDMAPSGDEAAARRDLILLSFYAAIVIVVIVLYLTVVIVVYCTTKAKETQFRSRLGWTLMTAILFAVPLVLVQLVWNYLLVLNADELGDLLERSYAKNLGIAADFSLISVALLTPLQFTVLTKICWQNLFGFSCKCLLSERDHRFPPTSLVDETASIFTDESNTRGSVLSSWELQ